MPEHRYRALLVGNAVFRRDPQGLPRLQGPRADVDALSEALADPESGLFATEDIDTHIDRNLQNLREELHRFFIEDATRNDVLFLYYSGHGKLDLLGRLHLCTSDTRASALSVTALRYKDDIDALIRESPAAATITILDCCHSGAFRGGELQVKASGSGRCVITSASANELALDAVGPGGTSPFTSALVTGLRFGTADGLLTAQDLYDYLETELSPPGNSSPQFSFDGEGSIVLARRQHRSSPAPTPEEPVAAQPADAPGSDQAEAAPSGLTLPEPRTLLWKLLNEAALSTLSDDVNQETNGLLSEVVEEAVRLDVRWPRAVLKRLGEGRERQVVVEALATGLTKHDVPQAATFPQEFTSGSPEYTGAFLAIAATLPESSQMVAESSLSWAIDSSELGRSARDAEMVVRILQIESSIKRSEPTEVDAALVRVAAGLTQADPEVWGDLVGKLNFCLSQELDQAVRAPIQANAALRLARFAPEIAREFFSLEGHFLHEYAFERLPIADITRGAAAMLAVDPSTGHRLFEIAERRCHSPADWIDFFDTLIALLFASPGPAPAKADHLVSVVERAIDRGVPDNEWWQLSYAAKELVASAPAAAGRLLRLDPDEDRMRKGLIKVAKEAAAVDVAAAWHIAIAAERLVLSILDEPEQSRELVNLAEAFAAIDPDHAMRLLRSIPEVGYNQSMAVTKVAAVFAKGAPDRIEALISEFAIGERSENLKADVYEGVALVDPERAIQLAEPLPDSSFKTTIIARAAEAMADFDPDRAAQVALSIEDNSRRARALKSIVRTIAASAPEQAATLARRIPDNKRCAYSRATALSKASETLAANKPDQAEELLELAERTAETMDDGYNKGSVLADIAGSYIKIGASLLRPSKLLTQAEQCVSAAPSDDADQRTELFAKIMIAWAAIAPRHAERIAEALPDHWEYRDSTLGKAARAMASADPSRAEQFASIIGEKWELLRTQSALVEEFCKSAPARAERLALSMAPGSHRARALLAVADAEVRRQSW